MIIHHCAPIVNVTRPGCCTSLLTGERISFPFNRSRADVTANRDLHDAATEQPMVQHDVRSHPRILVYHPRAIMRYQITIIEIDRARLPTRESVLRAADRDLSSLGELSSGERVGLNTHSRTFVRSIRALFSRSPHPLFRIPFRLRFIQDFRGHQVLTSARLRRETRCILLFAGSRLWSGRRRCREATRWMVSRDNYG